MRAGEAAVGLFEGEEPVGEAGGGAEREGWRHCEGCREVLKVCRGSFVQASPQCVFVQRRLQVPRLRAILIRW